VRSRVAIIEHGRIIDIDTPDGLVRRHCPERTSCSPPMIRRATIAFERSRRGRRHAAGRRVHHSRPGRRLRHRRDSVPVREPHPRHRLSHVLPTLEDVFLKLTGHSIRD
jgi:ABC-type multidrug transport system ATPase subunit